MHEFLNHTFRNQKDLKTFVSNQLVILKLNAEPIDRDSEHWRFMKKLTQRHPEYKTKIGKSKYVKCFKIIGNPIARGHPPHVDVVMKSNAVVPISWVSCVTKRSKSDNICLQRAMRGVVSDQIMSFRKSAKMICTICNDSDGPFDVDHIEHFLTLKENFIKTQKTTPTDFIFDRRKFVYDFKSDDSKFKEAWINYHRVNAKLRMLCANCNSKPENKPQRKHK